MDKTGNRNRDDSSDYITSVLKTKGGRLSISLAGFILYFSNGSRLHGYDSDHVKTFCIEACLPVIEGRMVDFDEVVRLSLNGPMVAVSVEASPPPWHAFSFPPLSVIAAAYRAGGAEVFNILDTGGETKTEGTP